LLYFATAISRENYYIIIIIIITIITIIIIIIIITIIIIIIIYIIIIIIIIISEPAYGYPFELMQAIFNMTIFTRLTKINLSF